MDYPEWAPADVVEIAKGWAENGANRISPAEIAHRLCTFSRMQNAWETMTQHSKIEFYYHHRSLIDRIWFILEDIEDLRIYIPRLLPDIVEKSRELSHLLLCYFCELDPTTNSFEDAMAVREKSPDFEWLRDLSKEGFPYNFPDELLLLAETAEDWHERNEQGVREYTSISGRPALPRTLFIRKLAERFFIPVFGSPMYRTLAVVAAAILQDESINEDTVKNALRDTGIS